MIGSGQRSYIIFTCNWRETPIAQALPLEKHSQVFFRMNARLLIVARWGAATRHAAACGARLLPSATASSGSVQRAARRWATTGPTTSVGTVVRPAKGALSVEPVRGALKPPKPLAAKEAPMDKCGPVEEADKE